MEITRDLVQAAVYGGAVLGGGGGGWIDSGLQMGNLALDYGNPHLLEVDKLSPESIVVTVAIVGAPAAEDRYVKPINYVRSVELLINEYDRGIDGLITNENGASTTVNGWLQAAVLGLPVVDAPCNGRAHPISAMGAMGLTKDKNYVSMQAASGGNSNKGKALEMVIKGDIKACGAIVRNLAVEAGGFVAVTRNPVTVQYSSENGAKGAIAQAIEVGKKMLSGERNGPEGMIEGAVEAINGEYVSRGEVEFFELETKGGFDVGKVIVKDGNDRYEMSFWNEYLTLEKNGERIATFPDLIMTLSADTGLPVVSAQIEKGQTIAIITTHRENLCLGSAMFERDLYPQLERAIGKKIINFVF